MKYELNQVIYYMKDNLAHSAKVLCRKTIESSHRPFNLEQVELFKAFGERGTFYMTCHGIINESEVYGSKADLLASL